MLVFHIQVHRLLTSILGVFALFSTVSSTGQIVAVTSRSISFTDQVVWPSGARGERVGVGGLR